MFESIKRSIECKSMSLDKANPHQRLELPACSHPLRVARSDLMVFVWFYVDHEQSAGRTRQADFWIIPVGSDISCVVPRPGVTATRWLGSLPPMFRSDTEPYDVFYGCESDCRLPFSF